MGRMKLYSAIALFGIAAYFLIVNIWGQSWIFLAMAGITVLLAFLNGRKMAAIVHDSRVLKKRTGKKFSISAAMAIPALFFMIFVLFMSLASMLFFRAAGLIVSVAGSGISTFIYSVLFLVGFYVLFSHIYESYPDDLKSSWGKKIEKAYGMQGKMTGMAKGMAGKAMGPMSGMMGR